MPHPSPSCVKEGGKRSFTGGSFIMLSAGRITFHNTSSTTIKVYRNDTPVVDLVNYKSRRSLVETLCVSTWRRRLYTSSTAFISSLFSILYYLLSFVFCGRMISPLQRTPITKFRFFHTISAICKKRFLIISLHLRRCIKSDTFKNPLSCVLFRDAFFLVQNM